MADRLGQRFGNYQLIQLLGQGGFAEVYLGKHLSFDSLVAIKVYRVQLTNQDIERFNLEARMLAHLAHPHIRRIQKFGVLENAPYLVMNYIPGGSLRRRHPAGSRVPLVTIVSYVNQIAQALQLAHMQNLIHRHIKPQNFLINNLQDILLSDFGIAVADQSSRYRNQSDLLKALTYQAPEQIEGHPLPASDQYALGIVVYEWLMGEPPFHGSLADLPTRHISEPPPLLRKKFPEIPRAVEAVIMKVLAKDWKYRFTDIQAFATALEQACHYEDDRTLYPTPRAQEVVPMVAVPLAVQQAPIEATPASKSPSRGISRRVVVSGLLGVVALSAIGGGIFWFSRRTSPHVTTTSPAPVTPTPVLPELPANSPMLGLNPQHTSFNAGENILTPSNVSKLTPYWTAPTGDIIDSTPAIIDKAVYVGSHDAKVYACDNSSGSVLWTATTGGPISSSPAIVNGAVYIGSTDNNVYALGVSTGQVLWKVATGDVVLSSPTVVSGVLYIGSNDHKLYAINAATGSILWTVTTGDSITGSPSVINGVVYVGSNDHTFYAVDDFSGTTLWTASTGDMLLAAPSIVNGVVYIGSADHSLYALDATTGKIIWTVPTGDRIVSGCAVANGVVYTGSYDHKLYACDAQTGKVLWTATTNDQIDTTPMVANGVVYFGSHDHKLYACDAQTGKVLWTATTGDRVTSSPVVVNGVVYAGSYDHKLYAFHLPH